MVNIGYHTRFKLSHFSSEISIRNVFRTEYRKFFKAIEFNHHKVQNLRLP